MHITLLTLGSRGDVQPMLALATGLRRAGHRVRIATHAPFESFIREFGFEFSPMPGNPRQMLEEKLGRTMATSQNPIAFIRSVIAIERQLSEPLLRQAREALAGTDLVLFSPLAFVGYHVAEMMGIPAIAIYLQPMGRTREFPCIMVPPAWPTGGRINLFTHALCDRLAWKAFGPTVRRWRRELGLPAPARPLLVPPDLPTLYAYSPSVVPKPADWGARQLVTGYWFLDAPAHWQPPPSLEEFLLAGPPPVCVTFGSMGSQDPVQATRTVREALRRTGQRGLLLGGWSGFDPKEASEDCLILEEAYHDWLFPRVSMVVSHGGAGTTAAALRAGVPAILIPTGMDQPFWGQRVLELGVGPAFVPRRQLNADRLARAISAVDSGMRERARVLGCKIREERGVDAAVASLESLFAPAHS